MVKLKEDVAKVIYDADFATSQLLNTADCCFIDMLSLSERAEHSSLNHLRFEDVTMKIPKLKAAFMALAQLIHAKPPAAADKIEHARSNLAKVATEINASADQDDRSLMNFIIRELGEIEYSLCNNRLYMLL